MKIISSFFRYSLVKSSIITKGFLSDRIYISLLYFFSFGKFPNLKKPRSFNENICKLILGDDSNYYIYTDKYLVRDYVTETIGTEYLVPNLGVFKTVEDIDFSTFPTKFVLKSTHSSGQNIVIRDKATLDIERIKKCFSVWLKQNYYYCGREKNYKLIQPRIIVDQYLPLEEDNYSEFKIFCFKGIPKFIQLNKEINGKRYSDIYDIDWNRLPVMYGYPNIPYIIDKPLNLNKLLILAEKLSYRFLFVRVDLYSNEEKVYFSELTFHPGGGGVPFSPNSFDLIFGNYFKV